MYSYLSVILHLSCYCIFLCDGLSSGEVNQECRLLCSVMLCYNEEQGICGTIAAVKEKVGATGRSGGIGPDQRHFFCG